MGDSVSKIKILAGYIKDNPDDSLSKFALALELIKNDRYEKARILFESIRISDPGYTGVYYHLGKTYEALGMNEKAGAVYREGIRIASANKNNRRTVSELKESLEQLEPNR